MLGGAGPAADRDQELGAPRPRCRRSSSTIDAGAAGARPARPGRRCGRRRRSSRAATSATSSPAKGSSRESRCSPPSTRVTLVPSVDQAWASSLPTGPPPSTIMLSGTCLAVVASRLFQASTESRPSIGGIAAPLPVATTTALRAVSDVVADDDPALAVEAAGAAEELDAAFFQPGQLARVVEVVDHLVAAVEDRLRVELAVDRRGDPGHPPRLGQQRRPGAAAPSRACRRSRSIRRRPGAARRSRPSSPPSARRPAQTSPGAPAPSTIAS